MDRYWLNAKASETEWRSKSYTDSRNREMERRIAELEARLSALETKARAGGSNGLDG